MEAVFLHNPCVVLILILLGLYVVGCLVELSDCD
jgi:hypothetical protein